MGRHNFLDHELAAVVEDLNPVSATIRHVDQPVVRANETVDRGELARWWPVWVSVPVVIAVVVIVRRLAVGAPVTAIFAGLAVVDHDSVIPVAVGDEDLIRLRVHPHPGGPAQERGIVAPAIFVVLADRHHEPTVARELHDPMMPVRAHPDVVVMVDEEPVRVPGKLGHVLRRGVAPRLDDIALGVELDDDRRRYAAGADGRILDDGGLLGRERLRQMGDPDVVLGVHEHGRHRAHDPLVRHLPGPRGVDPEGRYPSRSLRGRRGRIGGIGLGPAAGQGGGQYQDRGQCNASSTSHRALPVGRPIVCTRPSRRRLIAARPLSHSARSARSSAFKGNHDVRVGRVRPVRETGPSIRALTQHLKGSIHHGGLGGDGRWGGARGALGRVLRSECGGYADANSNSKNHMTHRSTFTSVLL